jgi:AraC-like DNA-binding protein
MLRAPSRHHRRPPSRPTALPFRIRTLGRVWGQPYHATAGTYHADAMLTVVRSGAGLYHRDGAVQRITRGFVGLVLPSSNPGLLMADPDDPYDHYFCRFAGQEALRMARAIAEKQGGHCFHHSPRWPEAASILDSMLALERCAPPPHDDWMTPAEGELARLLSIWVVPPDPDESRLNARTLLRYLAEHLSEPFELDAVARHFGVSRAHLSRAGRRLLGEPLSTVSTRLKLEFSRALLEAAASDFLILDVARRVGYLDALYFSKSFHKHFGMSPSRYRAEHQRRRGSS